MKLLAGLGGRGFIFLSFVAFAFFASCKKEKSEDEFVVITATGDIAPKLNEFRKLLGEPLNTAPAATGGRREINWDGVPDEAVGVTLPDDFFNPVGDDPALASRQRGLAYASNQDFRISANNFAEVNAAAANQFSSFSGNKVFANLSADRWEVFTRVPGKVKAAKVKGFGVVFSDVDNEQSTFIEYFNGNKSLGRFFVPPHDASTSFSFLGVYFKKEPVTRIEIGHDGTLADGNDVSNGGSKDLVVLDDFLYDEPVEQ